MIPSPYIRIPLLVALASLLMKPSPLIAEEEAKAVAPEASGDSSEAAAVSSKENEASDPAASTETSSAYAKTTEPQGAPYVFSWMDYPEGPLKLRGGRTKGIPVALATEPSILWDKLRSAELSPLERDKNAILAMQGDYRVSFDFIETELYGSSSVPSAPYRSWATERVYVLSEDPEKLELQHILVMVMVDDKGVESDPIVIKHWRQVWEYEPSTQLKFIGHETWRRVSLPAESREGKWVQTVYQVDDSPRYSLSGRWEHTASYSAWNSGLGHRPLPRREHSIRSDYQALYGTNRITITARGWVHSQDNLKKVLNGPDEVSEETPFLAREIGVNRYDRIHGFDFSPADEYLNATGEYWSDVRRQWNELLAIQGSYSIASKCEDKKAYETFFSLANDHSETKELRNKRKRARVLKKKQTELDSLFTCIVSPTNMTSGAKDNKIPRQ